MLELLAPAGSMEALRAAVQNGANAVYLGCGAFNARQSAKNFTPQTLMEAVKYCHVRGVAVHLTLNTLVSDKEIPELVEVIRAGAEAGVDAGNTELAKQDLLYDPQTAGGLLIAVTPEDADDLFEELKVCVPSARRIGTVAEYQGGKRIFLR